MEGGRGREREEKGEKKGGREKQRQRETWWGEEAREQEEGGVAERSLCIWPGPLLFNPK